MISNQALEGLDEIEKTLAAIRNSLADESFRDTVRHFVDWRPYFGAHPWLCCGAAAALGALVVPRRHRPRDEGGAESAAAGGSTASLAATMKDLAAEALVGESLVYLIQQGRKILERSGSNGRTPPSGEPKQRETAAVGDHPVDTSTASEAASALPLEPEPTRSEHRLKGLLSGLQHECVKHPEKSLVIALAAGVLLGWVAKRR